MAIFLTRVKKFLFLYITTRYAFTVISNLFVYIATYILLRQSDSNPSSDDSHLTRADAPKFSYLSAIVCVVGFLFQLIFHIGTNESGMMTDEQIQNHSIQNLSELKLDWFGYLKNFRFYNVDFFNFY